jgi:membrane protease YdiL (CAAX protease family)
MNRRFSWRLFGVLLAAGMLGVLSILPLLFTMPMPVLEQIDVTPASITIILLASMLQNAIILTLCIGLGLLFASKVGLGVPVLESWLAGEDFKNRLRVILRPSILTGAGVGVICLLALLALLARLPQMPLAAEVQVAIWRRLLACFYGGIVEELLMRLFLLSFLAWALSRVWRSRERTLGAGAFWTANITASIIFGLAHLPSASLMMPITPMVVSVVVLLNGIAGVAFGYLYWKHGLESAMLAHFTTDIVLHVIGPAFVRA